MFQQMVLSIQRAMVEQARVTAFAITNIRAAIRESYLSHLPHRFTSASKALLRWLDMDSDLLFDVDSVDKAIGQAQLVASVSGLLSNRSLNRGHRLWKNIHLG